MKGELLMRILIMRTIAHNKIWEGSERTCHYENQNYEYIKIWEPNIINHNLDQIKYGIGIYTIYYFNYGSSPNRVGKNIEIWTLDFRQCACQYFQT